jgi:peptidoglycan/xylan/chitin deacetylase (PgdA/CDA1 family)
MLHAQVNNYTNQKIIKLLHADGNYINRKDSILKKLSNVPAGRWGEFVKGVKGKLVTDKKVVALTFDACGGGGKGNGYDSCLINYLRKEKIPATLFITGLWIDVNYKTFLKLSKDPLFEIENHGLNHKPCSSRGDSIFGIKGTKNISAAFDEIEINAEKIKRITGRRPKYFRSATAFTDEACVKMAKMLGASIVSYDVLSGDAIPGVYTKTIVNNVSEHISSGSIIIMHFNHPDNNTYKALQIIIPKLLKDGYSFAKLEDYLLKGIR